MKSLLIIIIHYHKGYTVLPVDYITTVRWNGKDTIIFKGNNISKQAKFKTKLNKKFKSNSKKSKT